MSLQKGSTGAKHYVRSYIKKITAEGKGTVTSFKAVYDGGHGNTNPKDDQSKAITLDTLR